MSKERECVQVSIKAEIAYLKRSLGFKKFKEDICEYTDLIVIACAGYKEIDAWWKKVAITIILPLMVAFWPVIAIAVLSTETRRNIRILKEIRELKQFTADLSKPEVKDLYHLWLYHGLNHKRISTEYCFKLFHQWIEMLYGEKTADQFDLNEMYQDSFRKEISLNRPYNQNQLGSCHFYTGDKFMNVIEKVSKSLPNYA